MESKRSEPMKLLSASHPEGKGWLLGLKREALPLPHPAAQAPAGSVSPLALGPEQRPWLSCGSTSSRLPGRKRAPSCTAKQKPWGSAPSLPRPSSQDQPLGSYHASFSKSEYCMHVLKPHSSPHSPLVLLSEISVTRGHPPSKILNEKLKK